VRPGDLILGDDNGVCVLDPDQARELLPTVREVLAKEAAWREGFAEEYRRFARG
jgi:regulator of RNase E activity RraA